MSGTSMPGTVKRCRCCTDRHTTSTASRRSRQPSPTYSGSGGLTAVFDPDAVQELKAETTSNLTIGGANLAARAFEAGLVDECQLFVWPMILGGGKPALPAGVRTDLELLDEHRFGNGVVHLRYRVST